MRLCEDTLTLYNARHNVETDRTEYIRTVITGISWYGTVKSSVTEKGLKSANQYVIRIPMDAETEGKSYTDPKAWVEAENVEGLFTLNEGDLMAKGVTDDITRPADLQARHEEAITILGVTDNRRALHAKHFKVVGA